MQRSRKLRRLSKAGIGVAAAALILTACGSSTPPASNGSTTTTAPATIHHGGTAYFAEGAGAPPNYIFPFSSLTYFSVSNLNQFQYLMYRPLYWFGQISTAAPTFNEQLSVASAPVWSNSDKTVTVNLKGWKFSNGQTVDAQSVIFWMNMMKAEPDNWAGTAPGLFPFNIKSYEASSATSLSVTFNLTGAYNPTWFLYNQLSEITPMPEAWDITSLSGAPGSGGCGAVAPGKAMTGASTKAACTKVWTFDTDNNGTAKNPVMAGNTSTYASNPVWQVVDGPWRLSQFTASNGRAVFVPNPKYSGPQKPYLAQFVEVPYTQDTTEFGALEAGGQGAPDVGYAVAQDVPQWNGAVGTTGPNAAALTGKYTMFPVYGWSINYFPMNFNSNTDLGGGTNAGYVIRQLYFRQALQMLIDQPAIIKAVDKGYGVPTYGPVPIYPKNSFLSPNESNNPYTYDPTKAVDLLRSHGWTINKGGTDVCSKGGPSGCGAGVNVGAKLSFLMVYISGSTAATSTVNLQTSQWSQAGINVTTKTEPFTQVIGYAAVCAMNQGAKCNWEMANWGGGWIYAPDYQPTGEEIFATGAGSNAGSYSNPTNDRMIHQTNVSANMNVFFQWEDYLAKQLPVVWQPNAADYLLEVSNQIGGVMPFNALLNLTPEYWYFKS